jgi:hypothetical protein
LRDASDLFAKNFFSHLKGVDRIDLRECLFTSTGIQHILDYLQAASSSKALLTEVVLSGTQFGFKTIRAVSLRQFRWHKDIGVESMGLDL